MSSQRRPLFDSSFAALVLINARDGAGQRFTARTPNLAPRLQAGSATAMSIPFAPEPVPTAHLVDLGQDEATGPLPLGFEFEFFGARYRWFDLSADGFMTFGTHSSPRYSPAPPKARFIPFNSDLNNFIALGWADVCPVGRRHVAYEVRGPGQRRRLVLSCIPMPPFVEDGMGRLTAAQLVLHERTGMIDVHIARHDPAAHSVSCEAVRFTTHPSGSSCYLLDRHAS